MKYYFWANKERYRKLKDSGYKELECQTDDREAFEVDTENKTFEVVHKHVNCDFGSYMEDIDFILSENPTDL